jgi:hypothetical protein
VKIRAGKLRKIFMFFDSFRLQWEGESQNEKKA